MLWGLNIEKGREKEKQIEMRRKLKFNVRFLKLLKLVVKTINISIKQTEKGRKLRRILAALLVFVT